MAEVDTPSHDTLVETMTGGMVNRVPSDFTGSDLLREDGRPRPTFLSLIHI